MNSLHKMNISSFFRDWIFSVEWLASQWRLQRDCTLHSGRSGRCGLELHSECVAHVQWCEKLLQLQRRGWPELPSTRVPQRFVIARIWPSCRINMLLLACIWRSRVQSVRRLCSVHLHVSRLRRNSGLRQRLGRVPSTLLQERNSRELCCNW